MQAWTSEKQQTDDALVMKLFIHLNSSYLINRTETQRRRLIIIMIIIKKLANESIYTNK